MSSPQPPEPYLRASDADREEAAARLHAAAVEGRLDADELDERLSHAYAARWTSELDRLTADVTPPVRPPPQPVPYPPGPVGWTQPRQETNGLAVASLVASLVWFAWLGSVAGIVFGHVALGQINRSGGRQAGRGLAVAGLVIGYLSLLPLLLKLAF